MAFPLSPTNGQQYTTGGFTYQYNNTLKTWTKVASTGSNIGNVSLSSGTVTTGNTSVSTTGVNVGGVTLSNIGVNVGNVILSNTGVNVGNVTVSSTSVNVGNVTLSNTGVNVGNTTLNNNSITTNTITTTDLSVSGNTTITGNLTVSGTTTTINSTIVTVNDLNIVLANNASSASTANGAGITINGAGATMNYISSTNAFTFSHKIVADGSLLTSLTGANVSGAVALATAAASVSGNDQPNITSVGTLTSLAVTGNITGGNANLGNAVVANYFVGNGALLTGVAITDGNGITNLGTLSNLAVNGNVNFASGTVSLGSVGNVKLTGGSYGYVLSTDGLGNLAWTTQPSPTTLLVDTFTGTGSQTEFTLSSTPDSVNKTFVNYNGASLARGSYSLSGGNIVFSSAPASGAVIEVSTFQALGTQVNLTDVTIANLTTTSWATYQQTTDILVTKNSATGTVTHDLNTGVIFYHTSALANFTVNLTNVPTTNNRVITVVLAVIQGSSAYIPSALQIAGAAQTINWAAGITPTGNNNKKDLFTFTLLRAGAAWTVLGSIGTFG